MTKDIYVWQKSAARQAWKVVINGHLVTDIKPVPEAVRKEKKTPSDNCFELTLSNGQKVIKDAFELISAEFIE